MPDWKIHAISALLLFALLLSLFPFQPDFSVMALFLFLFSSLLPDLDHPKSLIRQILGLFCSLFISVIFLIIIRGGPEIRLASSIIMFLLVFLLFRKIPLRHRGRRSMHKRGVGIILFLACTGLFLLIGLSVYLSVFTLAGYWLHLGLDRLKGTKI